MLPLSGDRKAAPLLATPFNERDAGFSPDGRWITYISDESGGDELYAAAFPGPGGKWQVSSGGAVGGGFLADGKAIVYGTIEGSVYRAEVKAGATGLEVGAPTLLFKLPPFEAIGGTRERGSCRPGRSLACGPRGRQGSPERG